MRVARPTPFLNPCIVLLLAGLVLGALPAVASSATLADVPEKPTFYEDVQPILQRSCVSCHRPGGAGLMGMVAPMAFMDYQGSRPWARSMARRVEAREMPPWHADSAHDGEFLNQRTLTDAEIETVVRWAKTGALPGDPSSAQPNPEFTSGEWTIGKPDLVVPFEEPILIGDDVEDVYKDVAVRIPKELMPEDRYIKAMEFRPGSDVVHHIVIFTDDQRDSIGFPVGMLGGMGPGTDATVLPEGYGRLLRAGSSIRFNMHYHKEPGPGTATYDQSEIAFIFHDEPVEHEVNWGAVGTMNFSIPPNTESHEVVAEQALERDILLFALFPHTHLRGKASKITVTYPDGREELLLDVPAYDFNWQTNYIFKEPKRLPAGSKMRVQMWYDNSSARAAYTGIDPTRTVRWGQPTTDEMMYGFFDYAYAD